MNRYTIAEIKAANKAAGLFFFERSAMRFFDSRVERMVYSGPGGVFFITSEQFHGSQGSAPRKWTVRQFHPETGECDTAPGLKFNELSRADAMLTARTLAQAVRS